MVGLRKVMKCVLHLLHKLIPVLSPVIKVQSPAAEVFDQLRGDFVCGLAVVNEVMIEAKTRGIFVRLKPQYVSGKLENSIHPFQGKKKGWKLPVKSTKVGGKMSKKLNPGLFEDAPGPLVQSPALPSLEPASVLGQQPPGHKIEAQRLYEELNAMKTKMRAYESQMDVFKSQMSDFVRTIDQRFERISQALSRMEKALHAQGREADEKIRAVHTKMQHQGFEEAKIEGLIERQTVVIRNFENRLSAMQKIINEKELLLMKYFEALKHSQAPKK